MRSQSLVMVALLVPAGGQGPLPAGDPLAVETWVSQSAVWPGDEIEYSVRLTVGPRVELDEGRLDQGSVPWAPFRLLRFTQHRDERPDGSRVLTLSYRLVALDLPEQGWAPIPTLRFSYIRKPEGPTARTEFPMEERVVEGPRVAFRSMLPGAVEEATIRDGKEMEDAPVSGTALLLLGIAGLLVGAYPLGRSGYPVLRRLLARRHEREAPDRTRQLREAVAQLRALSPARPEDFERFCRGVTEILREHLANRFALHVPGLTSLDGEELRSAGLPDPVAARVEVIVRECEDLRYRKTLPEGAEARTRQMLVLLDEVMAA